MCRLLSAPPAATAAASPVDTLAPPVDECVPAPELPVNCTLLLPAPLLSAPARWDDTEESDPDDPDDAAAAACFWIFCTCCQCRTTVRSLALSSVMLTGLVNTPCIPTLRQISASESSTDAVHAMMGMWRGRGAGTAAAAAPPDACPLVGTAVGAARPAEVLLPCPDRDPRTDDTVPPWPSASDGNAPPVPALPLLFVALERDEDEEPDSGSIAPTAPVGTLSIALSGILLGRPAVAAGGDGEAETACVPGLGQGPTGIPGCGGDSIGPPMPLPLLWWLADGAFDAEVAGEPAGAEPLRGTDCVDCAADAAAAAAATVAAAAAAAACFLLNSASANLICVVAASPSMIGMCRSIMMAWYFSGVAVYMASASAPLFATATVWPSRWRSLDSTFTLIALSSAIRICNDEAPAPVPAPAPALAGGLPGTRRPPSGAGDTAEAATDAFDTTEDVDETAGCGDTSSAALAVRAVNPPGAAAFGAGPADTAAVSGCAGGSVIVVAIVAVFCAEAGRCDGGGGDTDELGEPYKMLLGGLEVG